MIKGTTKVCKLFGSLIGWQIGDIAAVSMIEGSTDHVIHLLATVALSHAAHAIEFDALATCFWFTATLSFFSTENYFHSLRSTKILEWLRKSLQAKMFDTDGIQVYLKRAGKENDHLRHSELEDVQTETVDVKSKKCHFIADGHDFVIVVMFLKRFNLYKATGVHVVVAMGNGSNGKQLPSERVIQRTWVKDQQHVFSTQGGENLTIKPTKGRIHILRTKAPC